MASILQRIGKEKTLCTVCLTVHQVEAIVAEEMELTIFFERGPQKDESKRFQLSPKIKRAQLDQHV